MATRLVFTDNDLESENDTLRFLVVNRKWRNFESEDVGGFKHSEPPDEIEIEGEVYKRDGFTMEYNLRGAPVSHTWVYQGMAGRVEVGLDYYPD